MKKITAIAMAVAALLALAIPMSASARWQHHNQDLQQNAQIQTTGQFGWEGEEAGAIHCQIDTRSTLLAGQTTASVTQFEVDLTEAGNPTPTQKCQVGPVYESFGCTDVSQLTVAGLPWTSHATNTQQVAMTTGTIQYHLHGGIFCPKTVQLTPGTVNLNMSSAGTWTTNQLSGQLAAHGPIQQNVIVTGHWFITPSGTYGVA